MRTVTSIRGRPSSASGVTSKPVTRRDASSQTGRHAEQRQHLGDVVALGAHRGGAPHGQPDRRRVGAGVGAGAARPATSASAAPTSQALPRRDRLRVDGVEVPPGRQHVDQPAGRRPGRAGRHVAAVERAQHVGHLVGGARPAAGTTSRAANSSTPTTDGVPRRAPRRPRPAPLGCQPRRPGPSTSRASSSSASIASAPVRAGPSTCAGSRRSPDVGALPGRPAALARSARNAERAPRAGPAARCARPRPGVARSTASTRLMRCSPAGALPSMCRPSRIWRVLDLAQVAVDVQHEVVEVVRAAAAASHVQVVVQLRGRTSVPDLRPARPGSLAGSSALTVAYSSSSCSSLARSP